MLRRLDAPGALAESRAAATAGDDAIRIAVREIITSVQRGGDDALRRYTEQFDGCRVDDLVVPPASTKAALDSIAPELRDALELAADRIRRYHEAQAAVGAPEGIDADGVRVTELVRPVDRAGLYVPGGRAAYPSTVLMTAIPARVAGVAEIVLCVPPGSDGRVPAVTLAAAALAGVDEVYRVGGAQAIAAMAYGTESIRAVDVIVGPGNAYVSWAKREVAAAGIVGIESPAGPSELLVVADSSAPARFVAADLVAQAEHGPGGAVILVTDDEAVASAVDAELVRALARSSGRPSRRSGVDAHHRRPGRGRPRPRRSPRGGERHRTGAPRADDDRSRGAPPARAQRGCRLHRSVHADGLRRLRRGREPRLAHESARRDSRAPCGSTTSASTSTSCGPMPRRPAARSPAPVR